MAPETLKKLEKYKEQFIAWKQHGGNFGLNVDYNELNQLAIEMGNTPFNIYCGDCRTQLVTYIYEMIKEYL